MTLSQKWKKIIIILSLLLAGGTFGYLISKYEGYLYLSFISAGMLIGFIFNFRLAWWFAAGILVGNLPLMLIKASLFFFTDNIEARHIPSFVVFNPLLSMFGSWIGHHVKKNPNKKSSQ